MPAPSGPSAYARNLRPEPDPSAGPRGFSGAYRPLSALRAGVTLFAIPRLRSQMTALELIDLLADNPADPHVDFGFDHLTGLAAPGDVAPELARRFVSFGSVPGPNGWFGPSPS